MYDFVFFTYFITLILYHAPSVYLKRFELVGKLCYMKINFTVILSFSWLATQDVCILCVIL